MKRRWDSGENRSCRCQSPAKRLICILMLAPGVAWTEGAVRHFDCALVRACDSSGSCTPESGKVIFSMAPVSIAPDGSGRFEIKYGSVSAPMQALSDVGPFHWKVGDEQNTLLLNSEREMLWHQLNIGASATANVRFMTCRYQP
jgi:hypothetical protein